MIKKGLQGDGRPVKVRSRSYLLVDNVMELAGILTVNRVCNTSMYVGLYFPSTPTKMKCDLKIQTTDVAKMVSHAWKKLTPDERKYWDALADEDKARYEREKMEYKGPWKESIRNRDVSVVSMTI